MIALIAQTHLLQERFGLGFFDDDDLGLRVRKAPIAIDERVVRALEAAKAVDELLYAVRFLPTWLDVPVAALRTFT